MATNSATREQVEQFLQLFKERTRWTNPRIFYLDSRPKNTHILATLGITPMTRDEVILGLTPEDYYQGPAPNDLTGQGDVWMFGKRINGTEVYIKIYINRLPDSANVCISFHPAEHPLTYPLKNPTP